MTEIILLQFKIKITSYLANNNYQFYHARLSPILRKYNKYNAEERGAWDVHTCCFAVVCVISYSTVVQYVT